MWCHLPTISNGRRTLRFVAVASLFVALITTLILSHVANAAVGINQTINFQGRLLNAQGAVVADGYYNIQFKIYQDGTGAAAGDPGGSLKWTETYVNNNGTSGVLVKNGYLSVNLGSKTPFGSSVNWNWDTLWLSMNVAGSDPACTTYGTAPCAADGEMVPMKQMTASPYALNAAAANALTTSNGTVVAADNFVQMAQGVQTDSSAVPSIFIKKTGTGSLIDLQNATTDVFTVANTGDLTLGSNANHTISVAAAPAATAGKSLTLSGGAGGSGTGYAGGDLVLQGGAAGGTNGAGGNLTIDAGAKTGTGADGTISIGSNHASSIQIGSTTGAVTQTVNLGNNNTTSSVTTVNIGSTQGASATNIKAGTGNVNITGNTVSSGTVDATGYKVSGTAGATTTCASGQYLQQQVVQGGITTGGTCTTVSPTTTLQNAYDNSGSAPVNINLSTAGKGISIVDNATPVGGNLLAVKSSGGTNYLAVTSTGVSTSGTINATGTATASSFIGSGVDVASAGTLSLGTSTANAVNIGNTAAAVTIQGGTGATAVAIQAAAGGTISIGTASSSSTQYVNIGNNTGTGTTSTVIGSGTQTASGISAGATAIQSKAETTITTNGTTRATFASGSNTLYLGNASNSGTNATPSSAYTIQATSNSGTGGGEALTLQAGNSGSAANGANLTLSGGTSTNNVTGLVTISTPTYLPYASIQTCSGSATSMNISQVSIDTTSAIRVASTSSSLCTLNLPTPTINGAAGIGRIVYITADNSSTSNFILAFNGGGTGNQVSMRANTSATMVWNGSAWAPAGASSSTTLQAAYDNTIQGSGGAELIVSKTGNTNGLTIRDSNTNSVNGALLNVQSKTAANLFSVSSNVTDYASDPGAETYGGSTSTFPANTWSTSGAGVTMSRNTITGNYVATGQGSVSVQTSATVNTGVKNQIVDPTSGSNTALTPNNHYNVSFSTRLDTTSNTFTTMNVYYSVDGTTQSVACITGQKVAQSVWTKVNCSFTAPSSITGTSNAILIQQSDATTHLFYVDNLSVTVAADYNLATDGGVDDGVNYPTNWPAVGGSATRITTDGYDASDSMSVSAGTTAGNGVRNKLTIGPLTNTLYRVSAYAKMTAGSAFTDFKIRYSPDGGTTYTDCVDYNTQTVATGAWTQITCYINTSSTAGSNPYVYFVQPTAAGTARTFLVDTFSLTLGTTTTPDVQIGSGANGGPTTLFTLDQAASAPIAANNSSLYGSMYYDTSKGKIQCYQASGWGSCGASPDNIITISPEYTNAVMHGPSTGTAGVGTMTSDFCSGGLSINTSICSSTDTYNYYKWTSPQSTSQTYAIYVTYQLPGTFKAFTSGSTAIKGRTDNGSSGGSASLTYKIYKNNSTTGLTTCGSAVPISSGTVGSWQTGLAQGAADPSTCSFTAGDRIIFEIDMTASSNANVYVSDIGFTFSNN